MLHRQEGFVISNIREPCDHYVSIWAYGSVGVEVYRMVMISPHLIHNKISRDSNSCSYRIRTFVELLQNDFVKVMAVPI
jgi:hypothetical protein